MKKPILIVGLLLTVLLVGLTVYYNVSSPKKTEQDSKNSSSAYIAIWVPLLTVFIVNKNKARNRNLTKNEKLVVIGAVALTVVLLVATILLR
ncbi:MAG: hypothetical protein GOU98_00070 [Candidatus Altiarchaeota archaeon]|nr:hypothetical protein [Candidatus Altiarchaeota archaeon]